MSAAQRKSSKPTGNTAMAGLPLTAPSGGSLSSTLSSSSTLNTQQYFSRATDISQMDMQAALDQMRGLITIPVRGSLGPHGVFKMAFYRKQTKNHWARDDPAFVFLQLVFLLGACLAYCVAFRTLSVMGLLMFVIESVGINWLGSGILVATIGKNVAEKFMYASPGAGQLSSSRHVKQSVEWLYAFDIHCNAFFSFFVIIYGVQFFLLPIVLGSSLLSLIISNTLYAIAFSWYFYITHLGYRALPFLKNTEIFLFPIAAVVLLWALNIFGYPFGLGWNASRIVAYIYFPITL